MFDRQSSGGDRLREMFLNGDGARRLRRGERLHGAGGRLQHLFLIEEGWIGRSRSTRSSDAAFTGIYIAGDIVAADGLTTEGLDDDLIALTGGSAFRLPTDVVREAVSRDADAAMELVSLLAADSGFLREALFSNGRQSSSERLSTFVLQTFHRQIAAGMIAADARRFDLPLSQTQLAAVTGVSPVHLNRTLQLLRGAGFMEVRNGRVEIHDMDALRREARSQSAGLRSPAAPAA